MQKKYFDNVIQTPVAKDALDEELVIACKKARDAVIANMDSYHVADAVAAVFELFSRANKYIDETTPWALAKDPSMQERLGTVLYNLLATIRWGAILMHPFIPETAEKVLGQLNAEDALAHLALPKKESLRGSFSYNTLLADDCFDAMTPGSSVNASSVLFARIDEAKKLSELEAERQAMIAAANAEEKKAEKPEGLAQIGIDQFLAVELRTAQVIACEPVPKAKKLLKLQLDLGYEKRQVVSGIAKFYKPEDLIGKKIVLVANLKPAVLCGVESYGMILASGEEQVRVIFLDPETPLGEQIH
jgi:methionyl-tRNA synthetase